jgi:excinuclease ABC subunit A
LVDRLKLKKDNFERLYEAIEIALKESGGFVDIRETDRQENVIKSKQFSEILACPEDGYSFPEINPKLFSFNSPYGACEDCHGLGFKLEVQPDYIFDLEKPLNNGGVLNMGKDTYMVKIMTQILEEYNEDPSKPMKELPDKIINILLYGSSKEIDFEMESKEGNVHKFSRAFEGMVNWYNRRYYETNSKDIKEWIERNFMLQTTCQSCGGHRLREEALSVKIEDQNIFEITDEPIDDTAKFFEEIELSEFNKEVAKELLREIKLRLQFLKDVGLGYLSLSRTSGTLSGGESQRVRLATQIGSGLTGVTYVLDEPTIGLHSRDNDRLIETLHKLKDLGNTVIIVEHDEEIIKHSDYIVDLGPAAGINGGEVMFEGKVKDILKNPGKSLTGKYLTGEAKIEFLDKKREQNKKKISIKGAAHNNLKNVDIDFPLGKFIVVTGVSGSGKSSLVMDTLYPTLQKEINRSRVVPGYYKEIKGLEHVDKIISIDQSPIGRTPRSNPATYTGVFDFIRDIFSQTKESKIRGYDKGRFSFNVKGGRCESCKGHGVKKIEMQFLPDVYVTCDVCKGQRYNKETLKVKYKGKTISDVLEMSIDEASEFFKNVSFISRILELLKEVGLGYLKLGQPATTLSGGEAQRIKLTSELRKRSTGKTFYILDEPTTGLHFEDVRKLLTVLDMLVEKGNTVVVIEHNMDVIKNADHIIDLGPDGGKNGGKIIAEGTPKEIVEQGGFTAKYLKDYLNHK